MILIHNKKNLFLAVLILLFAQNTISSPVKDPEQSLKDYTGAAQIPLSWEVGFHKEKAQTPDRWFTATVPGAVQLDLLNTLENPDWQYADGYKQFLWMEDVFFTYRANFPKPVLSNHQQLFFISKGIDYRFEIYLNGVMIFEQEGMFNPVETDLTPYLNDNNELLITIYPVPKSNKRRADRSQADHSFKPAVSYGWDWHPRLVPSGIWDDTYLEVRNTGYIRQMDYTYELDQKLEKATIMVQGISGGQSGTARLMIRLNNQTAFEKKSEIKDSQFLINGTIEDIDLWWPYELGNPVLYDFVLELTDIDNNVTDQKSWKGGFRKIRLVENTGAVARDDLFPKSRNEPPFTLEINNIRIFAKGTNWVNPEVFPGILTEERYKELLELAKGMHFTLLRVWGGGIVNKDSFFELCDQMGIMVWQEFPLACNDYPDDPSYLSVLRKEATSIVKRLHNHPCLVIWSGGNELFNSWSGMNDQSLALRWLNSICLGYSPEIPFIPTSPLMGVGHGHYIFYDKNKDEDVFQIMNRSRYTALTEFGMPSPSDTGIIHKIIPENEWFPPSPTNAWKAHHAYGAWVGETWLCEDILEKYFGKAESLEQLVEWGQTLQSIGYKAIFESARQKWPYCSMALNWCFNEPWPTAANNSIIQYPALPKPCFEAIKQACRPVMASAVIPKFLWNRNEVLNISLVMINGSLERIPAGRMEVLINGKSAGKWDYPDIPANSNIHGPAIEFQLSGLKEQWIRIELRVSGNNELNSEYQLLVR
jgi:beta-mannosidase